MSFYTENLSKTIIGGYLGYQSIVFKEEKKGELSVEKHSLFSDKRKTIENKELIQKEDPKEFKNRVYTHLFKNYFTCLKKTSVSFHLIHPHPFNEEKLWKFILETCQSERKNYETSNSLLTRITKKTQVIHKPNIFHHINSTEENLFKDDPKNKNSTLFPISTYLSQVISYAEKKELFSLSQVITKIYQAIVHESLESLAILRVTAFAYMLNKQYEQASIHFFSLIDKDPTQKCKYCKYVLFCLLSGNSEFSHFEKLAAYSNDSPNRALIYLAGYLHTQNKESLKAKQLYDKAVELNPNEPLIYLMRLIDLDKDINREACLFCYKELEKIFSKNQDTRNSYFFTKKAAQLKDASSIEQYFNLTMKKNSQKVVENPFQFLKNTSLSGPEFILLFKKYNFLEHVDTIIDTLGKNYEAENKLQEAKEVYIFGKELNCLNAYFKYLQIRIITNDDIPFCTQELCELAKMVHEKKDYSLFSLCYDEIRKNNFKNLASIDHENLIKMYKEDFPIICEIKFDALTMKNNALQQQIDVFKNLIFMLYFKEKKLNFDFKDIELQILQNNLVHLDASTQIRLAYMYEKGRGVKIDLNIAKKNYKLVAANKNNVLCHHKFSICYLKMCKFNKALENLLVLAEKYVPSQYLLGKIYKDNKDYLKAIKYFMIAASNNHPKALYWLAYYFTNGLKENQTIILDQNEEMGKIYYEKSAMLNYAPARFTYTDYYQRAFNIIKLEKYAAKDNPDALFQLGAYNYKKDYNTDAKDYLIKAANKGHLNAKKFLKEKFSIEHPE